MAMDITTNMVTHIKDSIQHIDDISSVILHLNNKIRSLILRYLQLIYLTSKF